MAAKRPASPTHVECQKSQKALSVVLDLDVAKKLFIYVKALVVLTSCSVLVSL